MISIILINGYLRQKCISEHNYTYKYLVKIIYSYYSLMSFSLEQEAFINEWNNPVFCNRLFFFCGKHKHINGNINIELNSIMEYDRIFQLEIFLFVTNSSSYHVNYLKDPGLRVNRIYWNNPEERKPTKFKKNLDIHISINIIKKQCDLASFDNEIKIPNYPLQFRRYMPYGKYDCTENCKIDHQHYKELDLTKGDNMWILFKTAHNNVQNKSLAFWDFFEIKEIDISPFLK